MKPWLLYVLIALCVTGEVCAQGFSREPVTVLRPTKTVYFKTNPFTIIQGPIPAVAEYRLGLEVVGSPKMSYQVDASYLNKSPLFGLFFPDTLGFIGDDWEFPGYRLQGQARYFFYKFKGSHDLSTYMLPHGLYVAVHASFSQATLKIKSLPQPSIEWNHFNISARFGTQLMQRDYFGMDFFVGLGYKQNTVIATDASLRKQRLTQDDIGLPAYYFNPVKFSMGFSFTFGLF